MISSKKGHAGGVERRQASKPEVVQEVWATPKPSARRSAALAFQRLILPIASQY